MKMKKNVLKNVNQTLQLQQNCETDVSCCDTFEKPHFAQKIAIFPNSKKPHLKPDDEKILPFKKTIVIF